MIALIVFTVFMGRRVDVKHSPAIYHKFYEV